MSLPRSKRTISTTAMPNPKFSYSPLVGFGGCVQTAGMVGLDRETGELVTGGITKEAECIFANVKAMMDEVGLTIEDMVEAKIYLADFSTFPEFNAVWDKFFGTTPTESLPARTTVGVSGLPLGAAIEVGFSFYTETIQAGCRGRDGCDSHRGKRDDINDA